MDMHAQIHGYVLRVIGKHEEATWLHAWKHINMTNKGHSEHTPIAD